MRRAEPRNPIVCAILEELSDEHVVANSMLSERLIFNTWVSLVITMPSLRFTPQSKFRVQCLMPAFENQLETNSVCTLTSLHS